jgi:hypothetical protein
MDSSTGSAEVLITLYFLLLCFTKIYKKAKNVYVSICDQQIGMCVLANVQSKCDALLAGLVVEQ